jgi:hypothetical protein
MKSLCVSTVLVVLLLSGCRGFQRQDSHATGFANALECVEVQGDTAERAAELCSRRGFDPSVSAYAEGFEAGLACARSKGAGAVEAAAACRQGA